MGKSRPLLRHLHGRPLVRRLLLSEVFGPPRSRQPHPTARRPPAPSGPPPAAPDRAPAPSSAEDGPGE